MTEKTTIRIPKQLADQIDALIERGLYQSRSEFVTTSVRFTLLYYAELRNTIKDTYSKVYSETMAFPVPSVEGASTNLNDGAIIENQGITVHETQIQSVYQYTTFTYLQVFNNFTGKPVQIGYNFSSGLEDRVRVLYKMDYGFKKKVDFIKVSICYLLMKTLEADKLYDSLDEYHHDTQNHVKITVGRLLSQYLQGGDLDTIIKTEVGMLFDEQDD